MIEIGGLSRPLVGERYNGDSFYIYQDEELAVISVIDGIGHGKVAHQISQKVCNYLETIISPDPAAMITRTHEFMKGSEGAALGIGVVSGNTFSFAALGNISCVIRGKTPKRFVSTEGLLGVRGRSLKNETTKLSAGDLIVMYSDGISLQEFLNRPPNFHLFSANGLARIIMKDYGASYDDATVVVVQVKNEV
jgi:serine phosphatase RsbU (regulator of sigma subunit)